MRRARGIALAALAALAVGLPPCARAEEGGGGHYMPGATASFIDALPGRPGLAVANFFTATAGRARGSAISRAGRSASAPWPRTRPRSEGRTSWPS